MVALFEVALASTLRGDSSDVSGGGRARGPRRPAIVLAAMDAGPAERLPDDPARLDALRNGNDSAAERAFSAIYYQYAESLWRFALRVTGSQDDAEEIVHDVFTHVWTHRTRFAPRGGVAAYLFRAVRNRAIDVHRHGDVVARVEQAPDTNVPGHGEAPRAPDAGVLTEELRHALRTAVAGLPERRRTALMLRYVHHLSYDQIGDVLDVSEKAAFILVSRTRESLRPLFERFVKN